MAKIQLSSWELAIVAAKMSSHPPIILFHLIRTLKQELVSNKLAKLCDTFRLS